VSETTSEIHTVKLPYEDAPPKATSSQVIAAIGKNPVRMENRQQKAMYGLSNKYTFGWAAVYPQKEETVVKLIGGFNSCRESACSPISSKDTGQMQTWKMVESYNRDTQEHWKRTFTFEDYINNGRPTTFLVTGMDIKKLEAGLKVIHHYERIARAGKTAFFPVNHTFYKASRPWGARPGTKYTTTDQSNTNMVLVVAPAFWHHSMPMASMFLLLIRAIAHAKPGKDESVHQYLTRACGPMVLHGSDADYLKKVYKYKLMGRELDMISVACRRWRLLSRAVKKHSGPYCGHWGSYQLCHHLDLWQTSMKTSTKLDRVRTANYVAVQNALSAYKEYIFVMLRQLQRESRRVARTEDKKRSAEKS